MLHCFKKDKSDKDTTTEICTMYTRVQTVHSWFRRFGTGNFNLEDEERSGHPSNVNTELIKCYLLQIASTK